jgi:O-antigen/teichoic acid export membrane protein
MADEPKHLVRGVLVNLGGILVKVSRPIYLLLFSRLLGVESFGLYMLAFATWEAVSKFAILGLNWGAKQVVGYLKSTGRAEEIRPAVGKILAVTLVFSSLVAVALALSAGMIANLFDQPDLARLLRILCLGLPTLCGMYVLAYSYRPTLDMRYELYVCSVIEPVGVLVMGVLFIRAGWNLEGVALAHVLASASAFAAALFFFFRLYPPGGKSGSRMDWEMLFHGSVGMGGMELLNNVKMRLDLFVLARFLPLSYVGIYGAIVEIASLLKKLRAAIDPILMPIAQKLIIEKDKEKLKEGLALTLSWSLQLGLAFFGVICLIPETLISLFGADFVREGAGAVLIILSIGQFFNMSLGLLEGVLAITGFAYAMLANVITLILVNLFLLILLVPEGGLAGAALATTSSYVGVTVWRVFQARRLLEVSPFDRSHLYIMSVWAGAFTAAWGSGFLFDFPLPAAGLLRSFLFLAMYASMLYMLRTRGLLSLSAAPGRTLTGP